MVKFLSHLLLGWFEKRRKTNTLQIAQRQMTKAMATVNELDKALTAFSEGKKKETEEYIEKLFLLEEEVDDLRRSVFEESTKGSLPDKYREDLMHLVKRLDVMADFVKDSGRNLKVLLESEIPKEIMDANVYISNALVECAILLSSSIEMLGVNAKKAKDFAKRVDVVEGKIDDKYLKTKSLFIKYSKKVDPATLMILKDLLEYMEQAADMCTDTADYIRLLATAEEEH